ncbi:ROK family protein [Allostreptomyces psammosilenae]|uniref:Glucokinase n=1 Tax=Allostreptomyces psammosilenae TaxID=1892865 RepID=A0A852ZRX7_9ACTN|nr:ROK family protein [Allostreptomyces psammosilenae]NYI04217.1 glucokinase [Allostreptomyces psammosilenae]
MDVGGTTLRVGSYAVADGRLTDVRRTPVEGMARHPGDPVPLLQRRVVDQIAEAVAARPGPPGGPLAVGIAFAGPTTADGLVLGAPTVWGRGGEPLPLGPVLQERLGRPVVVVNDITAAAWRYAATEPEPFCLLTVSSGIGAKVFRHGEVLLSPRGHGGELGHWRCDPAPDAPPCDCGGRGHLGGIASGRGALAAARRAVEHDPAGFAGSLLGRLCQGRPERLDNPALAAAVRAGDPFATGVLRDGLRHLAGAVTAVFTAIGVTRYIVIGGFALAVGPRYAELLTEELRRLGCFGLTEEEIGRMVTLGHPDDDHGLLGVGALLGRVLDGPARPAPAAPGGPGRPDRPARRDRPGRAGGRTLPVTARPGDRAGEDR